MPDNTLLEPEQWVDAHSDYLFRYAYARVRDAATAEDIVQDTLLSAYKHRNQFSGTGSERAWLAGILRRKVIDHFRARTRSGEVGLDEDQLANGLFTAWGNWSTSAKPGDPLGDGLERAELWQAFWECLRRLPERQADVFALRHLDDADPEKICKDLTISSSNLWVLLHRARLRLSQCLRGRGVSESDKL